MKEINLSRKPIDASGLLGTGAKEADTTIIYDQPGIYCLDGKPVIIYGRLAEKHDRMLWALRSMHFSAEMRGPAWTTKKAKEGKSQTFGYRPRVSFGTANFCGPCSMAMKHPKQHSILCEFGMLLNALYEAAAPETAARHSELLKGINADWIMPATRFTSGIANHDNPLKYHYDKGNLVGVMSCMVVFRNGIEGGYLSIPELDARWLLDDNSYFLFDGQVFLHGVTPIKRLNKNSYRYSVVYYSLRAMEKCGTMPEELARARVQKREREKRRL